MDFSKRTVADLVTDSCQGSIIPPTHAWRTPVDDIFDYGVPVSRGFEVVVGEEVSHRVRILHTTELIVLGGNVKIGPLSIKVRQSDKIELAKLKALYNYMGML